MRLEDIAINLRVRTPYESIDLGYRMVMAWRRDVFPIWLSVYLAAGIIINLLCFTQPIVALFILWWLKPAFDRVILHVLSAAAFGAVPSISETWRALPRLWFNNGLFKALTIRRFDLVRSFSLPVTQLERQFGGSARKRRAVLGREARGAAGWLTIISMHFEVLIGISAYVFIDIFMPGASSVFDPMKWFVESPTVTEQYLSNAVSMLAVLVLEPFYVAAGFALYLNARTVLEGWDIELAFKRMNARLTSVAISDARRVAWSDEKSAVSVQRSTAINNASNVVSACVLAVLVSVMTLTTPIIYAEPNVEATADANAVVTPPATMTHVTTPNTGARDRAKLVVDDPQFGYVKKTWSVNYIGSGANKPTENQQKKYPWLEKIAGLIGKLFRVLAWVSGGILVVALVVLLVKQIEKNQWRQWFLPKAKRAEMLFGLDVRAESLPDDVAASASLMLARGDMRGALSLLYRGALVYLIDEGKIEIARGDTEGVCVKKCDAAL
ncbi:MAG: hypothetical protein HC782_03895 [Gammaproteobacteria bacterium]|nr:hypothetical protein [Gammaproteobacteria bacterium]